MGFFAALRATHWIAVCAISAAVWLFLTAAGRMVPRFIGTSPQNSTLVGAHLAAAVVSFIVVLSASLALRTREVDSLGAAVWVGVLLGLVPAAAGFAAAARKGALRLGAFRAIVLEIALIGAAALIFVAGR